MKTRRDFYLHFEDCGAYDSFINDFSVSNGDQTDFSADDDFNSFGMEQFFLLLQLNVHLEFKRLHCNAIL